MRLPRPPLKAKTIKSVKLPPLLIITSCICFLRLQLRIPLGRYFMTVLCECVLRGSLHLATLHPLLILIESFVGFMIFWKAICHRFGFNGQNCIIPIPPRQFDHANSSVHTHIASFAMPPTQHWLIQCQKNLWLPPQDTIRPDEDTKLAHTHPPSDILISANDGFYYRGHAISTIKCILHNGTTTPKDQTIRPCRYSSPHPHHICR